LRDGDMIPSHQAHARYDSASSITHTPDRETRSGS